MSYIKKFRQKHQLSQRQLGEKLGWTPWPQGRVSNYENGRRTIPPHAAKKFVDYARSCGEEASLEDLYK